MEQYFQDGVLYLYTKDVFLIVFTFPTFLLPPPQGWVPPLPPVVMAVVVGGW